jgi:hypothetical protein
MFAHGPLYNLLFVVCDGSGSGVDAMVGIISLVD